MNYKETTEYLFHLLPVYQRDGKAAYKNNLDNTLALDAYFEHPHQHFKSIHLAGTNGKGSTSHMIAAALQKAGVKTGLYTSPHLKDFRERIKVDGQAVSEEFVVRFVAEHQEIIEQLKPSFFEITVAMAFLYFKEQGVEVAVVETGMGGRLDSTNIITPLVSVITNIGLDHTQYLGDTLTAIAGEKAGIIKYKVPVVIGECGAESRAVFEQKAAEMSAPVCCAAERFKVNHIQMEAAAQVVRVKHTQSGTSFDYRLDLQGDYQPQNLLTALCALEVLVPLLGLEKQHIVEGLEQVVPLTGLLGRWQRLGQGPDIICDTAHNEDGLRYVLHQLQKQKAEQLHLVLGFVNDKAITTILKMFPKQAHYYFCQANIPRALPVEQLVVEAQAEGLQGNIYYSVAEALQAAKEKAGKNDLIFIGGSTFVVSEIL